MKKPPKPKILIIDDIQDNIEALEVILEDLEIDIDIVSTTSPSKGIQLAARDNFAVMLLDVQMPDLNGFEVANYIRKEKKNKLTPIIFISAVYSQNYYNLHGVSTGAVDFISKPIVDELIIGKITQYLQIYLNNFALKYQKEQIEEVNEKLVNYTNLVSHDLKEPIRNITSLIELIMDDKDNKLSTASSEYVNLLNSSAIRAQQLIDDLLYLSRIGKEEITYESVELNTLIENVSLDFKQILTQKNVTLSYTNLPTITCQRIWMQEVFKNLISNSIKYNDKKDPHINITYENTNSKYHIFHIEDNGIGFDMEFAPKIFKLFKRLQNQDEYSGTGAGLAIVKKIIKEHQGSIEVTSSTIGKGTVMSFTILKKLPKSIGIS